MMLTEFLGVGWGLHDLVIFGFAIGFLGFLVG